MDRRKLENELCGRLTAKGLKSPRYAVVIPVVYDEKEPSLLIEVRAEGIFQAGDPCFPGGKIEPGETPSEAASREMKEELGIFVEPSDLLGQLPTVQTRLGSRSNIYVCVITREEADRAVANPAEVARLLRVPISFFLKDRNAANYSVDGHVIWGMTAGAIRYLCAVWKQMETK